MMISLLATHIRSAVFNVTFFTGTALLVTCGVPLLFLPLRYRNRVMPRFTNLWLWGVYALERTILRLDYTVTGLENLPDGPCVIAMKHQSAWETMKLYKLFGDIAIIIKQELIHIPLWGRFLAAMPTVPIDRRKGRDAFEKMAEHATNHVAQGRRIVVFPQGTRVAPTATTQDKPYKTGAARLAKQLYVPLVPVAINAGVFWGRHAWLKRRGTITIAIQPALDPSATKSVEGLHAALVLAIEKPSQKLCEHALENFR